MDHHLPSPGAPARSRPLLCRSAAGDWDSPLHMRWPLPLPPLGKLTHGGDRAGNAWAALVRHWRRGGAPQFRGSTSTLLGACGGPPWALRNRRLGLEDSRAFPPILPGSPPSPPRARSRPGGRPLICPRRGRAATNEVVGVGGAWAPARRWTPSPLRCISGLNRSSPRSPLSNWWPLFRPGEPPT